MNAGERAKETEREIEKRESKLVKQDLMLTSDKRNWSEMNRKDERECQKPHEKWCNSKRTVRFSHFYSHRICTGT